MARIIEPNVELEAILARSTPTFERSMLRLSAWIGRTLANGQNVYVSTIQRNPDFQTIERVLYQTNLLCDLLGRRRTLLWRDKALADEKAVKLAAANPGTVIAPEVPPIVFEEAVNAITTRNPEIAVGYEAVQRIYQRKGFGLAISTSEKLTQRVQDELSKGLKEGRTYAETAAEMERIAAEEEAITGSPVTTKEWTKAYSETVYRTTAASSYEAGKWEQVLDPDVSGVIVAMEYVTMEDSDVRPEHAKLHGLVAGVNDPVWQTHAPPLGYNSVLPGAIVSGRYVGASKALYSGTAIEIKMGDGRRLSVTANHPVLTSCGWRLAKHITKGDYLLCNELCLEALVAGSGNSPLTSVPISGRTIDDKDMPARIEDVFDAMAAHGSRLIDGRDLALNFHGDAKNFRGNIHVVGAYRELWDKSHRSTGKAAENVEFSDSRPPTAPSPENGLCPKDSLLEGARAASGCGPCVAALPRHKRRVLLYSGPLQVLCLGPASELRATKDELAAERLTTDTNFVCELLEAGPGHVSGHQVADVRHFDYCGHVYDLQSTGGWIVANGIYISNCRCDTRYITRAEAKELGLMIEGADQVSKRIEPEGFTGEAPNPEFRTQRPDQTLEE